MSLINSESVRCKIFKIEITPYKTVQILQGIGLQEKEKYKKEMHLIKIIIRTPKMKDTH